MSAPVSKKVDQHESRRIGGSGQMCHCTFDPSGRGRARGL